MIRRCFCLTSRGSAVRIRQRPQLKIKDLHSKVSPFFFVFTDNDIHNAHIFNRLINTYNFSVKKNMKKLYLCARELSCLLRKKYDKKFFLKV